MRAIHTPGVMAVPVSENRKLGLASATYVAQASCPKGCPLLGRGCYAEGGRTAIHSSRLNAEAGAAGLTPMDLAANEAEAIGKLPGLLDLRLHVVGDSAGRGETRAVAEAAGAYHERLGRRVWTYTHAEDVPRADWGAVSVLRSCGSAAGVRKALELGYAPAVVVPDPVSLPFELGGVRFIPCPYQARGQDCVSCRLCLDADGLRERGLGIAFAASGSGRAAARRATRRVALEMVG